MEHGTAEVQAIPVAEHAAFCALALFLMAVFFANCIVRKMFLRTARFPCNLNLCNIYIYIYCTHVDLYNLRG